MLDQPALEEQQGQLSRSHHTVVTVPFQQPQLWNSHIHEKQRQNDDGQGTCFAFSC